MFVGAAFAVVLQFPNDNILRWGKNYGCAFILNCSFVAKSPRVQFVPANQINVRLKTSAHMNNVEMPALLAPNFGEDRLHRRNIEIRGWKDAVKTRYVAVV